MEANAVEAALNEARRILKTDKESAKTLAQQAFQAATAAGQHRKQAEALLVLVRANEVFGYYNQQGIEALELCLELATRHGLVAEQLSAFNLKITHLLSSNKTEAEAVYEQAAALAAQYHDSELEREKLYLQYTFIQLCIASQKNLETAFTLANQSLAAAEKLQQYDLQTLFLQSLAILNAQQGNTAGSARYLEELISLAIEHNDPANVSGAAGYLAFVYYGMGDQDNAEKKYDQAEQYALKAGNIGAMITTALRRIRMYTESQQTEKAGKALQDVEPYILKTEIDRDRNLFFLYKADYLSQTGKPDEALQLLLLLQQNEAFMLHKLDAVQVYQRLHSGCSAVHDYENAYRWFLKFYDIRSELLKEESAKTLAELQARYDAERKEVLLREARLNRLNAELKAIRSQMNPHFVFNVMNTVDSLIAAGEAATARQSLHDFAKMMRTALHHGNEEFSLIEEEISFLENYMRLEKLSLGDTFDFEIHTGTDIDPSYDRVPTLMLQPLVENAIKHGLRHKAGSKKLNIHFSKTDTELRVEIIDNGIGRQASAALYINHESHRSFATHALGERIRFLNQKAGFEKYLFEIIDLESGTSAVLRIRY